MQRIFATLYIFVNAQLSPCGRIIYAGTPMPHTGVVPNRI